MVFSLMFFTISSKDITGSISLISLWRQLFGLLWLKKEFLDTEKSNYMKELQLIIISNIELEQTRLLIKGIKKY